MKAKLCMISLSNLKFDDIATTRVMRDASNEIQKILEDTFKQPIEVLLWNTDIKFLDGTQLASYIKSLKKLQKKVV